MSLEDMFEKPVDVLKEARNNSKQAISNKCKPTVIVNPEYYPKIIVDQFRSIVAGVPQRITRHKNLYLSHSVWM